MSSRTLIKGTLILTVASVITRILGLGNRMFLSRLIGAEGLGLFQMMLPFYTLFAVITNLGLSGAVVKSVSDRFARQDYQGIEQVRHIALSVVIKSALIGATLLFLLPFSPLRNYFPDQRIIMPMRLMPVALFCSAIASIFKSYFQGQENMVPTAISQVTEQGIRVGLGVIAAYLLYPYGLEYAVLGIMIGVALGEMFSLGLLLFFFIKYQVQYKKVFSFIIPHFSKKIGRELAILATPLVFIRLSGSLTYTVISFLIPIRLQYAGLSVTEATAQLGMLLGMAFPLIFLPTVAIIPLTTALVPSIASAASLNQKNKLKGLFSISLLGTLVTGLLTGVVLYFFNEPITAAIYSDISAAPLAAQLALVAPFAYLQFTTASILHGLGHPGIALFSELTGTLVCLFLIYTLTANPVFGIQGAIIGYNVGFAITSILGLFFIKQLSK